MRKFKLVAASLVACVIGTAALAATFSIPFDDSFDGIIIPWGGAIRGESTYVYKVVEYQGRAAVCGGFFYEGSGALSNLSRQKLRVSRIEVRGHVVKNNLGYFTHINIDDPVDTITVRCKTGRLAWHPSLGTTEPEFVSNQSNFEF